MCERRRRDYRLERKKKTRIDTFLHPQPPPPPLPELSELSAGRSSSKKPTYHSFASEASAAAATAASDGGEKGGRFLAGDCEEEPDFLLSFFPFLPSYILSLA